MPVSTFSSDNSARGHGRLIERWNSTRERMAEDERRMSVREITEMDGTGLHERANWPLGNPVERRSSVSPSGVEDGEVGNGAWRDKGRVRSEAVIENSEDIGGRSEGNAYYPERDVSPDHEQERVQDVEGEEDGNYYYGPGHQQPILPAGPKTQSTDSRARRAERSGDTLRTGQAQVSPALEQENGVASKHRTSRSSQSPVLPMHERQRSQPSPSGRALRERNSGYDWDRQASYNQRSYPSPVIGRRNEGIEEDDDEEEESRDLATPISFGAEESTQRSHSPATPRQTSNTSTPNGHARASSILKTTPLSRSTSRASSHTTHIPHNKDRVRYSWQSLQDDAPNRPRIHIIKLMSEVATASAGFPGGEAFGFSISSGGRKIAAYNSARLYVLQTAALPVGISQDYALKRRPLAVEIADEGNLMAILADAHTVNVYDLGHQQLRRTRTIKLDFPTNCIALAPSGGLLAAAYEGGVEIFSLDPNALLTDRRAVRSQRMDRLTFSEDGSTLLGSTTRINVSSTLIVSVPVFPAAPDGRPTHEELKEAWCTELLHPENIRNSSHATFMREHRQCCNDRVFSWNGAADTFGILQVADMQYGNIDFPVVISPPLSSCGGLGAAIHSCPAIDEHGDTIAMIVNDRTIRLYIVPHKVEDDETSVEAHSIDHELDEGYGCPFSEARWLYSSASYPAPLNNQTQVQGRLIVTSPGGVAEQGISEEMADDVEGGRIILFDFDPQFAGQPGQTFSLTLGKSTPQLLEEQEVDVADEVALVRRRTVNQSKSGGLSQKPATLGRSATTFNSGRTLRSASPGFASGSSRRSMLSIHSMQSEATQSLPDLLETNESGEAFDVVDEPYAQNAPRSHVSLQRAASNAQRHRFQTIEERTQERVSVDSSGGFLPLPEYSEEPNAPLPSRFRAMAGLDAPPQPPPKPAIVTSATGHANGLAFSGPATAPPHLAASFSAEEAFRTPAATYSVVAQQRQDAVAAAMAMQGPVGPVSRADTLTSVNTMPRSLQRAYSNAISPLGTLGTGTPPNLIGDWENVSPVVSNTAFRPTRLGPVTNGSLLSPATTAASTVAEEERWDAISPVAPSGRASSPFERAQQAANGNNPYRYSTSLLNPPGHAPPDRTSSSASSYAPISAGADSGPGGRRLPAHMQAFRNAAAASASASASLFPPTQAHDHVPYPPPPPKAGSVAHPITAWHPPAASAGTPSPPKTAPGTGYARGGHLKGASSAAGSNAFPETERGKRLAFFNKRAKKTQPFTPDGPPRQAEGGENMMETRSLLTVMTGEGKKCTVM
ncbi:hypothetical protein LTR08_002780 [Meristemomyces frigidus]|nr:hypothetical protein LTR08_002780 [Meristemomyces frigidus]